MPLQPKSYCHETECGIKQKGEDFSLRLLDLPRNALVGEQVIT